MTIADHTNPHSRTRWRAIELRSWIPELARVGDRLFCPWQLTNADDIALTASFYLRSTPALIVALKCPSGKTLRGYHHGSAVVRVSAEDPATITALLDVCAPGRHDIRVAIATRDETLVRTDSIRVDPVIRSQRLR
jgi:hypothetical protein